MKILIDIGHPGHVHYFRNLIRNLQKGNNEIIVTARERGVVFSLLEFYKIKYFNRGKGNNSVIGKLSYMFFADWKLLMLSLRKKPDLFLSFSSPYAAQVANIMGKPHIAINDTEHTDKTHAKFTYPFSSVLLTPKSYQNDLGSKQIRFNNVVEGLYLHTNYYKPNPTVLNDIGVKKDEKFVLLRFVSWHAHHDYGQSGLDISAIRILIELLENKYKVFISSELPLSEEFQKYKLQISPEQMHDVLYYASLFIGESGTMASESAFLGTPAVYINSLPLMCYLKLEQEAGILKHFPSSLGVVEYVEQIIQDDELKEKAIKNATKMKERFIDPTAFLTWFIENYPESSKIMKENPDYQYTFK
jgi:predicted glycosyltransferase